MEKNSKGMISKTVEYISFCMRKCLFLLLSIGPIPTHIAFIMDGNRRYAKRHCLVDRDGTNSGHHVGFKSLIATLQYCYEMGVKYVTVYAFSIDNFRRDPQEVQSFMDLMKEKIDELLTEESLLRKIDARINFWGNLDLLTEPLRAAAAKAMDITANNKGPVLSFCVAYTSTNEITHAIEVSVRETTDDDARVTVNDLERNMYTSGFVEPDIVIRTSGETRLSNFLLWQSDFSHLQNPTPLWPEFSLSHLVWSVLEYQKVHAYLKKWKQKNN